MKKSTILRACTSNTKSSVWKVPIRDVNFDDHCIKSKYYVIIIFWTLAESTEALRRRHIWKRDDHDVIAVHDQLRPQHQWAQEESRTRHEDPGDTKHPVQLRGLQPHGLREARDRGDKRETPRENRGHLVVDIVSYLNNYYVNKDIKEVTALSARAPVVVEPCN